MLKIKDLRLNLGGEEILKGINLTINAGEIHSILGTNGTGKSSFAYSIMGLAGYQPQGGKIVYRGNDITNENISKRAKLGMTLSWQEPARFEGLTVKDYLSLSNSSKSSLENINRCLMLVGLLPKLYLDRFVDKTLSGGERKKVELASILVMEPKLAILDEPDSGIDIVSIQDIIKLIKLLRTKDSSILLITHREEIAEIADRASLICGGQILKTGDPLDVGKYYKRHCDKCDHIGQVDKTDKELQNE